MLLLLLLVSLLIIFTSNTRTCLSSIANIMDPYGQATQWSIFLSKKYTLHMFSDLHFYQFSDKVPPYTVNNISPLHIAWLIFHVKWLHRCQTSQLMSDIILTAAAWIITMYKEAEFIFITVNTIYEWHKSPVEIIWISFPRGPFYWHGLTLIPAWINNNMPSKVWDEITYPFSRWSLGIDK